MVRLTEVGPRDGLQNESAFLRTRDKIRLVDLLSAAGFPEIEVSSFVSPSWVPQLRDAAELFAGITRRAGIVYSALVPNERGLERALAAGVDKIAIFTAASQSFARRNINATIEESLVRLRPVIDGAHRAGLPVRGYLSCVVACPFEGPIAPRAVASVAARLLEMGVDELDLGDTLGVAEPPDIERLYAGLAELLAPSRTTLHLHNTRGHALACATRALELGVRSFDSSCGGLGGCPYAPGASGNVASEALIDHLEASGFACGVARQPLLDAAHLVRAELAAAAPPAAASATAESRRRTGATPETQP
jgi:hydroxymethylglutaryl-CoA lyase